MGIIQLGLAVDDIEAFEYRHQQAREDDDIIVIRPVMDEDATEIRQDERTREDMSPHRVDCHLDEYGCEARSTVPRIGVIRRWEDRCQESTETTLGLPLQ